MQRWTAEMRFASLRKRYSHQGYRKAVNARTSKSARPTTYRIQAADSQGAHRDQMLVGIRSQAGCPIFLGRGSDDL
jgi:hypothetical protein